MFEICTRKWMSLDGRYLFLCRLWGSSQVFEIFTRKWMSYLNYWYRVFYKFCIPAVVLFQKKHPRVQTEKRPAGSFFFFHQKSFCFCFEKTVRLLKKRKKGIICARPHHISALDRRTTTRLLLLPSSRISSTTTHTFAENNEPFFVVQSLSSCEAFFFLWW